MASQSNKQKIIRKTGAGWQTQCCAERVLLHAVFYRKSNSQKMEMIERCMHGGGAENRLFSAHSLTDMKV